jgi:hypothetical protein
MTELNPINTAARSLRHISHHPFLKLNMEPRSAYITPKTFQAILNFRAWETGKQVNALSLIQ